MSIYESFRRSADGFVVDVTEPFPRWVTIKSDSREDSKLFGLTLRQAEGLHSALGLAIRDARADDEECKSR